MSEMSPGMKSGDVVDQVVWIPHVLQMAVGPARAAEKVLADGR